MSRENKVYKQFWIHKGDSNFCSELRYNIDTEKDEKVKPDDFYDIVSTNDTIEGGLHVVEYAALESANAEKLKYQQEMFVLNEEVKVRNLSIKQLESENGNLAEQLESANAENERLAKRLIEFAVEHPSYKLSKELEVENKKLADHVEQLQRGARQFAKYVIDNSRDDAYNNIQAKAFLEELEALKTPATTSAREEFPKKECDHSIIEYSLKANWTHPITHAKCAICKKQLVAKWVEAEE